MLQQTKLLVYLLSLQISDLRVRRIHEDLLTKLGWH